jgi:hypothetical protein
LTGGTITGNLTVSGDFRADTVVVSGAIVASGAAIAGNVNIGGDVGVSGDLTVTSLNEGPLAGFRNLLINANPVINQRRYVSGTPTTSNNQYTLDRWRVVTSGQALSWTEVSGIRTVTAPSQGVVQVVESGNNLGGIHTLSWRGTARATINTIPVAAGTSVSLPPDTSVTVLFSGGTFAFPQLESGPVATPFERRPIGLERNLCERYFYAINAVNTSTILGMATAVEPRLLYCPLTLPCTPRVPFTTIRTRANSDFTWVYATTGGFGSTSSISPSGSIINLSSSNQQTILFNNTAIDFGLGVGYIFFSNASGYIHYDGAEL